MIIIVRWKGRKDKKATVRVSVTAQTLCFLISALAGLVHMPYRAVLKTLTDALSTVQYRKHGDKISGCIPLRGALKHSHERTNTPTSNATSPAHVLHLCWKSPYRIRANHSCIV